MGAQHVRWGVPWYRVNPAPGVFDWSWIDEALDHLVNKVGCIPIIDLMHYGTPLWMENAFINSAYPARIAEYAFAFAERYKDLGALLHAAQRADGQRPVLRPPWPVAPPPGRDGWLRQGAARRSAAAWR